MPSALAGFAPNLDKYLKSLKGQPLELTIDSLISLLKRNQISGAEDCAVATAHCLLQVVARSRWQDVDTLLDNVTRAGSRLSRARPDELVIANVARRVLGLIRDEALEDRSDPNGTGPATGTQTPLATPLGASVLTPQPVSSSSNDSPLASAAAAAAAASTDPARRIHALRSEVIDGIEEILDEISQVDDQVGAQADVHIRPGDHVLLHQPSATVQRFILRAAARRKFSVLIDTRAPTRDGRPNDQESTTSASGQQHPYASFRKKLSAAGIPAVNISAGSAMAYMSRVDKVIMGASAIAASGGIVTDAGASVLARAAHACGTTVVVLAGIYKLSPVDPASHDDVIEWANPITFVDFGDAALVHGVTVRAALKEFVPHELIDTYITNLGTHSREHLSGLIADHYKPQDTNMHLLTVDA